MICENTRAQHLFYNELLNWFPEALFLPELEMTGLKDAIPDPEISAERFGILEKLSISGRQVVVVTADRGRGSDCKKM